MVLPALRQILGGFETVEAVEEQFSDQEALDRARYINTAPCLNVGIGVDPDKVKR